MSIEKDTNAAATRLSNLRSERTRIAESLTLGQQSMAMANAQAKEARALLNPLNHPLLGKGKK